MSKPPPDQAKSFPAKITMISLLPNLLAVILILAAILFISAGRLDWLQAWAFVLAFGGYLAFYGLWSVRNDQGQLQERSQVGKNTKSWDKVILTVYTVLLIGMLTLAGLDAGRFRWAPAPLILQGAGWLGTAFAGFLVWWTVSVNTFLSRTVRIQEDRGQRVIDTGPYSWIRHPMYLGIIVLMLSIPLLLGSLWALIPGTLISILFTARTGLEDRTLLQELPGYMEYASRVRYRLLPWIW
jgi:protein-S-isoprenylcysteine O-methyltransferase Ste14